MLKVIALSVLGLALGVFSFSPSSRGLHHVSQTSRMPSLWATSKEEEDLKRMNEILMQESMNSDNMKATAEQMKNMKPSDMESMINQMKNMPATQRAQLENMGMNPDAMAQTMEMLKDNPDMLKSMGSMMERMTPEELMEQSRLAQASMQDLKQPTTPATTSASSSSTPSVVNAETVDDDDEDDDNEPIEPDPQVLDTFFKAAEIMSSSDDENAGVTFEGFLTVPPVAILSGNGEDDLSMTELTYCWKKGCSSDSNVVDRSGFERVWRQVQDNYYSDIVEEAQERMAEQVSSASAPAQSAASSAASPPSQQPPIVGANISPEQLQDQVKNLKDADMDGMFDRMSEMTAEDEARMKSMGVDPAMMKKSADMMKNNPMLRKAATAMLRNTSPEQLMKASQKAQEQMANMSEADRKKLMDRL